MKDLNRMEAYDISNINGFETVGSMIVYEKGRPKRSDYRKFKLRTVSGPDDYASMHEVLTRRFTHGMQEQKELEEKNMPQEGMLKVLALAKKERENGRQVMIVNMKKNKKFQKEQLAEQGYTEITECYRDSVDSL